MFNIIKKSLLSLIIFQLTCSSLLAAEATAPTIGKGEFNLQEITLPSEVKDMTKTPGAIYYSTSVKNKVLIPVHMWGEINKSGLHFVPADTSLIKGLSLAGGPTAQANLEDIVVTRPSTNGTFKEIEFDLSEGGNINAHQFKIESGDTIFVKKSTFSENRAYYTSLISIFITIASTFFIINKVK
jgi:hypothetical protein